MLMPMLHGDSANLARSIVIIVLCRARSGVHLASLIDDIVHQKMILIFVLEPTGQYLCVDWKAGNWMKPNTLQSELGFVCEE